MCVVVVVPGAGAAWCYSYYTLSYSSELRFRASSSSAASRILLHTFDKNLALLGAWAWLLCSAFVVLCFVGLFALLLVVGVVGAWGIFGFWDFINRKPDARRCASAIRVRRARTQSLSFKCSQCSQVNQRIDQVNVNISS